MVNQYLCFPNVSHETNIGKSFLIIGKITIANVNLTISDGTNVDLIEVKIKKGCITKESLNETNFGQYADERKCWTSQVKTTAAKLDNEG